MDKLVPIFREVFNKVPGIKTDRELLKNMVIGYTITQPEEKANFDALLKAGFIDALFNVDDIAVLKTGAGAISNIVSKELKCETEKVVHSINLWYQVIKNADDELVPETTAVEEKVSEEAEKTIVEEVVKAEEPQKEPEKTQTVNPAPIQEPKHEETKQPKAEQETQPVEAKAAEIPQAKETREKSGLSGDAKLGLICFLVFIMFLCIKLNAGRSMDRAFFGTTFGDKPKKTKVVKTAPAKQKTARVDLSFLDENTKPEPAPEPKPEPQAQPEQPKEAEQTKAPVAQQAPESKPQTAAQPAPQKKQTKQRTTSNTKVKKVPTQMPATQQQAAPAPAPVQTGPDEAELARRRREENLRRINSAQ